MNGRIGKDNPNIGQLVDTKERNIIVQIYTTA